MRTPEISQIIIYLEFHSKKRLVGSWSRAPDQIQMYSDTIAQLLPAHRIQKHMIV